MPGFRHGAKRGVLLVVTAFLVAVGVTYLLPRMTSTVSVPQWVFPAVGVAVIVSMGLTLKASKYWSYAYLAGFIIGVGVPLVVLLQTRFLGLRALLLYGGAAVGAVALRVKIHA